MPRTQPLAKSASWRLLLPLFAVVAIDAAGAGILLPLLPLYARHFGASPVVIGLLLASFSLCQFLSAPVLGIASDRLGRKRLLVVSQVGTCLSFLLLASAHSLFVLLAARILDGLTSGNIAIAVAYASDESEAHLRRQAIGVVSAGMGVGTLVGPALGGALLSLGESLPFLVAAGISLASIAASIAFLPRDRQRRGLDAGPAETVPPGKLLPKLRDLAFVHGVTGLLAILSIFYLAFGLFTSQLALVLNARFQWNGAPLGPAEIGYVLSAASVVSILVQLTLIRPLGSLIGDRKLAAFALLVLAAGFIPIGSGHGIGALAAGIFAVAVGAAFARPALVSALSLVVPSSAQGAAMGISQALGSLINVGAPIIGGFLIQAHKYALWGTSMSLLALAGAAGALLLSAGTAGARPAEIVP